MNYHPQPSRRDQSPSMVTDDRFVLVQNKLSILLSCHLKNRALYKAQCPTSRLSRLLRSLGRSAAMRLRAPYLVVRPLNGLMIFNR